MGVVARTSRVQVEYEGCSAACMSMRTVPCQSYVTRREQAKNLIQVEGMLTSIPRTRRAQWRGTYYVAL